VKKKTVALISCVSRKLDVESRAEDLYASDLFEKTLAYARLAKATPYILSAKYGLLGLDDRIETYNETLKEKTVLQRQEWSARVLERLRPLFARGDEVLILAGEKYREFLIPAIVDWGVTISVPLEGLSIGNQLKWLGNAISDPESLTANLGVHSILAALKQHGFFAPVFSEFVPPPEFPERGVYVFTDPKETSRIAVGSSRVVRIGTHAVSEGSRSTLWQRLRTHRGTASGTGNHRSSIFRLHVGNAIAQRAGIKHPTWGQGQSAPKHIVAGESDLEIQVSKEIGRLSFYWIPIADTPSLASDRSFIERNLIAILSRHFSPFDIPRPAWLGIYAAPEEIRKSGLWNVNHTADFPDFRALQYLRHGLDTGIFFRGGTRISIAPADWRTLAPSLSNREQLTFLPDE
jgi:hypothetical protein